MQINKKRQVVSDFHDCLLCSQAYRLLQPKHVPFYHFNRLCNGDERVGGPHPDDLLIISMINVIFEYISDWS